MKYFISHRGNIDGVNEERENTILYMLEALEQDYDVEVDIRYIDGRFFLGHDESKDRFYNEHFSFNKKIWFHAKDIKTLNKLLSFRNLSHIFFHQEDEATITSSGYIWTYIGKPVFSNSIVCLPERSFYTTCQIMNCVGICSDIILNYRSD